jgi:putative transposase
MYRTPENRSLTGLTWFLTTGLQLQKRLLMDERYCQLAVDALLFYRTQNQIRLFGFVIMPDHVHLLLQTCGDLTASSFMNRFKTYVSRNIGQGPIWQRGFWSEVIEGEKFIREKLTYIHNNPVKALLVEKQEDYLWSSAPDYYGKYIPKRIDNTF